MLAEDRRLREFFEENRLLMLPLEEEVVFLRQCSERFRFYADILRQTPASYRSTRARRTMAARRRARSADGSGAEALSGEETAADVDTPGRVRRRGPRRRLPPRRGARRRPTPRLPGSSCSRSTSGSCSSPRSTWIGWRRRSTPRSSIRSRRWRRSATSSACSPPAPAIRASRRPTSWSAHRGGQEPPGGDALCRLLEGIWEIEIPVLTIEGPNYTYPSDINELRGATRGFIRSDEEGLLTSFHESSSRAPFSVILIDEVEKAHSQLLTFFLSILDRGTTTDNRGKVLNFSNCMLFFTSNLGYSDAQQGSAPIGYSGRGRPHQCRRRRRPPRAAARAQAGVRQPRAA